jgi:hypothetical protein
MPLLTPNEPPRPVQEALVRAPGSTFRTASALSMAGKLGIAGTNGDYSYVALFYRNNRLYQIDGTAFAARRQAEADAMRFQQSLDLT